MPHSIDLHLPEVVYSAAGDPRPNHRPNAAMIGADGTAAAELGVIIENELLPAVFEELDHGNNFFPGLVVLHTALFDTWRAVFPSGPGVKTVQGKGMAAAVILVEGNYYVRNSYALPEIDTKHASYEVNGLVLHDMGHCFYLQHAPRQNGGGGIPKLHDDQDQCVMAYDPCDGDLCGVCVASHMGLDTENPLLQTNTQPPPDRPPADE